MTAPWLRLERSERAALEVPESLGPLETILQPMETARGLPAVYFLVLGGRVVYVGQSASPAGRWVQHVRRGLNFDQAWCFRVPHHALSSMETVLIDLLRPPCNARRRDGYPVTPKRPAPADYSVATYILGTGALEELMRRSFASWLGTVPA